VTIYSRGGFSREEIVAVAAQHLAVKKADQVILTREFSGNFDQENPGSLGRYANTCKDVATTRVSAFGFRLDFYRFFRMKKKMKKSVIFV
jgi:hypothetical protein